ncbi:MAG: Rieske 2Fe-2S domain-containing protein, partial [Betaproteobacteria bacterium]|nr:Rieske 2Fe-2S domain-containing protein [Betaproteobacteria bacterium]
MSYRSEPDALQRLVQFDQVHRDVYVDAEVFDLEMERLWCNTWVYVGHTSQVPKPGDYFLTEIARQPLILVRDGDAGVKVLYNRCAHKGARVVSAPMGNVGK